MKEKEEEEAFAWWDADMRREDRGRWRAARRETGGVRYVRKRWPVTTTAREEPGSRRSLRCTLYVCMHAYIYVRTYAYPQYALCMCVHIRVSRI